MEEPYPYIVEEKSGDVPAEIQVPRHDIGYERGFVVESAHSEAGEGGVARGVELVHERVELFVERKHIFLVLAEHSDFVGNAPHNDACVVVLLEYELFHLRNGVVVCLGHMA